MTLSDRNDTGLRVRRVGLLGAGVMGRGIAQAVAAHGHEVILVDLTEQILKEAMTHIARNLKALALMGGGRGPTPSQILARILSTTDPNALADTSIVIENVTETLEAKRGVYSALAELTAGDFIVGVNTSTFPIAEIAAYTPFPERVIGIHFMNPAETKSVVEVIPAAKTSAQTLAAALDFLGAIGKSGIVVADAPGFVSNRILMLTINEAVKTVEASTASAADVDRIFVGCFGHPMGPLATADLIGLDTVLLSLESLQSRFQDRKYEPAVLLRALVHENRLGRKSNHGFFRYGEQGAR